MSIIFGPRTITNGLVLALDAANPKSYPGIGTAWTDLSGNGNNGTLVGGTGYNSANGGSLVFDGTNDYVTVPSTNGLYLVGTSQVSVSCWAKTDNVNTVFQTLVMWEDIADGNAIEPIKLFITNTVASGSPLSPGFEMHNTSSITSSVVGVSTVVNSTYYNLVGTYDGTTLKLYINGALNNQVSASGNFKTPTSGTSAKWIIGRGELSNSDRLLDGNIAQASVYNRALTATEVSQNYNALKSRYI